MRNVTEWKGHRVWRLLPVMLMVGVLACVASSASAEMILSTTWSAPQGLMYTADVPGAYPATGTWQHNNSAILGTLVGTGGGVGNLDPGATFTWSGNRLELPSGPYPGDQSAGGVADATFLGYTPTGPGDHNFEMVGSATLFPADPPFFAMVGPGVLLEGVVHEFRVRESASPNNLDMIVAQTFEVTGGLLTNPANGLYYNVGQMLAFGLSIQAAEAATTIDVEGFSYAISSGQSGTQFALYLPEPGSLVLLALGGLGVLRRRRG